MLKKKNIKEALKEQLELIRPGKSEILSLNKKASELISSLNSNLKKHKISADVFVGGSSAKNTLIKKSKYDIDVFVRFDSRKYKDGQISGLLEKAVPKNAGRIHGSRDYFSLKSGDGGLEFEIIPVLKISKPSEAKNITDLSFFHVKYVTGKIKKNKKLADEIRLAKAFAYYNGCYGAESYINGFSGYALELLVICYKSFLNFIRAVSAGDIRKGKIILDPEKLFKNKEGIIRNLNESKLISPIIVIDPTYKERNALAALSPETFVRFQSACRKFLKSPGSEFFRLKDREREMKSKFKDLAEIKMLTEKQAGDIAGTKLKKFAGFFTSELERYFDVRASEFVYDEKENTGKILLSIKQKKEIIFSGPPIKMKEPLARFKKEHKKIKIVKGKAFAFEKNNLDFDSFLKNFENAKGKVIEEMGVSRIEKAG